MGPNATKPVFSISNKARFKPVSSATETETSRNIENSPVASLHIMILSKKRITKALIRLRGCASWSVAVLFANHRRQVFSRRGPYYYIGLILLSDDTSEPYQREKKMLSQKKAFIPELNSRYLFL